MNENNGKEVYPVEFPSRGNKSERSPIIDTVEAEIFPEKAEKSSEYADAITEVVATEITPEREARTTHGRYM